MNCTQARELLPAYVMGALDQDELTEVEAHLRAGQEHDDELVELRATVFALDRFADARSLDAAPAVARTRPSARAAAFEGPGAFAWLRFTPAWKMAGAGVAALALFAAGWLVSGSVGNGTGQEVSLAVHGPGGQSVTLRGDTSEARLSGTMAGFERLPDDRVYQLWAIREGTWVRIGVCNPDADGNWAGEWPFEIRPGEQIAMTIEPLGGSDAPTTEPILVTGT